jgi:hypothetical protein
MSGKMDRTAIESTVYGRQARSPAISGPKRVNKIRKNFFAFVFNGLQPKIFCSPVARCEGVRQWGRVETRPIANGEDIWHNQYG